MSNQNGLLPYPSIFSSFLSYVITYAYAQPSALLATATGDSLQLAAYAEDAPAGGAACFFRGQLRDSWLAARGLSTLAKVVAVRFVPRGAGLRHYPS